MPCPSHSLRFHHLAIIWWNIQLIKLVNMQFFSSLLLPSPLKFILYFVNLVNAQYLISSWHMTLISTQMMPDNFIVSGVNYERRTLDTFTLADDTSGLQSWGMLLHLTSQKSKRVKASTTLCQKAEILPKRYHLYALIIITINFINLLINRHLNRLFPLLRHFFLMSNRISEVHRSQSVMFHPLLGPILLQFH